MTFLLVTLLWCAQQPQRGTPEPSAKDKQISQMIGQIRRLASSEPLVFGIDTRLRTAEVLTSRYAEVARDLLRDAQSARSGVVDSAEQDSMGVRLARAWAPLDLDQSERVILSLRRTADHDYPAEAYDHLYLFLESRPAAAREIVSKGLRAGAFRMVSASRLLEESTTARNREATSELFSELLAAFPSESGYPKDVVYLLDQATQIARINRKLALEAVDKTLRSATQDKLLRQIASLLRSIDSALLEKYKEELKDLPDPPPSETETKPPEEKPAENIPDVTGLSYSEALTRIRGIESLPDRISKLIELSRREDLTPQQRASVASEALSASGQLPLNDDRLTALAMIGRDFARRNELAMAGLAGHMLSETFSKACECGGAKCRVGHDDFDCLQNVEDFAEYLDEFKISPESMGVDNISLEARLLILRLKALLTAP